MFKQYIIGFFIGMFLLATPIMLFSWYVDPLCFFNRNTYGMYWKSERFCKVDLIKKNTEYDSLIIGNSRTAWIDSIDAVGNQSLNVSFSGAQLYEIYIFLEKFLDNNKTVFIGLDYEMLYFGEEGQENIQTKTAFDKSAIDYIENLLGFKVISRSIANHFYRDQFIASYPLGENGNRLLRPDEDNEQDRLNRPLEFNYNKQKDEQKKLARFNNNLIAQRTEILKKLKTLLIEKNANYKVFINPLFPKKIQAYQQHNAMDLKLINDFSQIAKSIFPETHNFSVNHPYKNERYRDPSHYYPSVGTEMIKQINNIEP